MAESNLLILAHLCQDVPTAEHLHVWLNVKSGLSAVASPLLPANQTGDDDIADSWCAVAMLLCVGKLAGMQVAASTLSEQ